MYNNSYNPFSKGRWYKFFIETTEGDYKLTTSDIEGATISSSALVLPKGFRILEKVFDIHNTGAFTLNISLKGYADGSQGCTLPGKAYFDYATIYLFCERTDD